MKEIAIRLKGKPALANSLDREEFKESIQEQFLILKNAINAFFVNYVPGVDTIRADFNFYIPSQEFFDEDNKLTDQTNVTEVLEVLKETVLEIMGFDEDQICSLSAIKRPSNNGNYEMFIRFKRIRVGELNEKRNDRKSRVYKSSKSKYPAPGNGRDAEW